MLQLEPLAGVDASLSAYYCSSQVFHHALHTGPMRVAGKVLLNVKAGYALGNGVQLYLNARNALTRPDAAREGARTDRIFSTYLLGLEFQQGSGKP